MRASWKAIASAMVRPMWRSEPRRCASLLGLLVLSGTTLVAAAPQEQCQVSFSNGSRLTLPVARSWQEQQEGLSGRLDAGPGLLFLWTEPVVRALWMKNTYMPLSAAFIAADGRVLHIVDMASASEEQHSSPAPVIAAIELAQGEFRRLGIQAGDHANIDCAGNMP